MSWSFATQTHIYTAREREEGMGRQESWACSKVEKAKCGPGKRRCGRLRNGGKKGQKFKIYISTYFPYLFFGVRIWYFLSHLILMFYMLVCVCVFVFVRNLISVSLKRNNKLNKNKFIANKNENLALTHFFPFLSYSFYFTSEDVFLSSSLLFPSPISFVLPYSRALPSKFLSSNKTEWRK